MSFLLMGRHDAKLRLKSFSVSSRGVKTTIRIEVEVDDPFELGYALQSLAEVQKSQRTKPAPEPKAKPLALPKPVAK